MTRRPCFCRAVRRRRAERTGLTLLELMLALALASFVLVAIGMAIDLHLKLLDSRRGSVERIQLARAVLQRIADDLRATIQQHNADFSNVSGMAADAMAGGVDATAVEELAGGTGSEALAEAAAGLTSGDTESSAASTDIAASGTPPPVPGLYGNQYELQLDVSRLPRVDEYERMMSAGLSQTLQDIPSDVKTVAYYYQDAGAVLPGTNSFHGGSQPQSGLVRRVLDRAVTLYAFEHGNVTSLQNVGEVIAPEVMGIEFQYFDGTQWLFEWDSEQQGGLPVAVRITLALAPPETSEGAAAPQLSTSGAATALQSNQVYSLVVRLPTAKPCEATETTDSGGMEAVGL